MTDQQSLTDRFARSLAAAKQLMVLTGAGISKESGVPTFRDAQDGLWAKYNPHELATPQAFRRNPRLVWDWYQYRRSLLDEAAPNPGHYALANLDNLLPQVVVVTQNVDGFHQQAGSADVICLHGDLRSYKCFGDCQGAPTLVELATLDDWEPDSGPPLCPHCGEAYVRPNVVWFNESLPAAALRRANQLARTADVSLVVGTSGVVYPAATLPIIARQHGATVLEINPQQSDITPHTDYYLAAPAGEALPDIVARIRQLKSEG